MGTHPKRVLIAAFVGAAAANLAAAQTFTRVDVFPPPFGPTQGSSWGDYDSDGDPDIFVASGNVFAPDAQSILYRNRGDGAFDRIMKGPIVEDRLAAFSGAWADFDNDRDLDLLVAGSEGTDFNVEAVSSPRIYRNEGFGQFSRFVPHAFPNDLKALTSAAVWFDLENDGDLDAYLGNDWGPNLAGTGVPNMLFRNDGRDTFTRIERDPSVEAARQTLSVATSDFDGDGDMDLFAGNGGASFPGYADDNLYLNDGQGGFIAVTDSDVVRSDGWTCAPAWIDYDNDGDMDLSAVNVFSAHFLFRNEDGQSFTRITEGPLVTDLVSVRLGATWADFDNDGDLDVFVNEAFGAPHMFYINDGSGTFARVESDVTSLFVGSSSGGDYDLDGDIDLFVGDGAFDEGPSYLLQNAGSGNAWVSIRPQGRTSNTTGIGAKISVSAKVAGQYTTQMREITQQTNWGGHGPLLAHVGLGDASLIDEVRIDWPSGKVDVARHVRRNTHYVAVEGRGLITLQEDLIARLIERLDELAAAGTIRRGQHFVLRAMLVAALKLAPKHGKASDGLMYVFVRHVNALLRDEVLSDSEASWLLDPSATARLLLARAHG